jgi:hypothetical protein
MTKVTHYHLRWYTFEQIDTKIHETRAEATKARWTWVSMVKDGIDAWAQEALTEDRQPQNADERAEWYADAMNAAYHEWIVLNNAADTFFARWGAEWSAGFDFVDDLVPEEEYLADKEAADAAEDAKIAAEELF